MSDSDLFDDDPADVTTGSDVLDAAAVAPASDARYQAAGSLLQDHRVQAFLGALRDGESGGAYNKIVGGGTFDNGYSRHPRIYVPKYDSTSAGACQFNYPTWRDQASRLGLQDFSPHSQDIAAVDLLNRLGAIPKLLSDDLDGAVFSAANRWESLPIDDGGKSNKGNPRSLDRFKNDYYSRLY